MPKSPTSNRHDKPAPKPTAPAAGTARGAQPPAAVPVPAPVKRAVRLMLGGAAGTFALAVYLTVVSLAAKSQTIAAYAKTGHLSASQVSADINGEVFFFVLAAVVVAAVWVLMARMNREGKNWARITASAFFLIWSFSTYQAISGLTTWVSVGAFVIELAIWGVGAATLYYLWRPDSAEHFKRQRAVTPGH
jgi:hypothetical protein